jgi:hypothetical protein
MTSGEDEPRLSSTQAKRSYGIFFLQCRLDELVAAVEKNPSQEGN